MDGRRVAVSEVRTLPSGLVTFLLTDVVGSTRLWERAPEAMVDALARHDELIGDAVRRHGGVLLKAKGEGDSTFSVFARAGDAAGAALAAQRALRAEPWPERSPVTVRMALHSGEAVERDGDYFGRTVNRVARLRSIAEGGEVLLTAATAGLIGADVPLGGHLVELGVEQLKDLDRPETVFVLTDERSVVRRGLSPSSALRSLPLPSRLRAGRQQPIVGRRVELGQLEEAWASAVEGRPGLVIVRGEAGIGKSRLVSEVAERVHHGGGIVLAGRCDELGGSPFQPFTEALRFVAERLPRGALTGLAGPHWPALARLVPDLVDGPAPATATDVDAERERLFTAVRAWFAGLSREAPVLLVVEDVHWSPDTTLALLQSLLQGADDERLLVVVTSRPAGTDPTPVGRLVEEGRQLGLPVRQIELGGLTPDEIVLLLEGAERPLVPAAVAEVYALTDGNPLFTLAIATAAAAHGDHVEVASLALPESVHAVLGRQLAMLDEATLDFLRAAAILGRAFEVDLAAELAGASFDAVEAALDTGERQLVVREQSAGALHVYEFQHALVASTLVDQLTAIRRRRLHAAAAHLVATAPVVDGDRVSRVAHHAELAATALPADEAAAAFRAAAAQARDRMAVPEAVSWLERARHRLAGAEDRQLALEVDVELGAASLAAGSTEARALLGAAAGEARELGATTLFADALIAGDTGGATDYLRVDHARVEMLEAALAALGPEEAGRRAKLLVVLANELTFADDTASRRIALADEAVGIARGLDDPSVFEFVADQWLWLLSGPAHAERRLEAAGELLRRIDGRELSGHHRFSLLAVQSRVLEQLGRVEEGHSALAELRAIAEAPGALPRQRLMFAMTAAGWDVLAGRLAAAEASIRAAYQLVRAIGVLSTGAVTARQMLAVRFWQDRTDTMVGALAEGPRINPMLRAHQAYWLVQAGRMEEAATVWAEWDDGPVEALLDAGDTAESVVLEAAAVCATFDGPARCRFYASLLEPYGERIANPLAPDQPTHHYLGLLASAAGDVDQARARFEASIDVARRVEAPLMAARSSLELATLLLDQPDERERAVALARQAVRVGTERQAAWLVRTGSDVLARAGAA